MIADDSGIEALALESAPGVRSARFAGEHATDAQNLSKLLAEAPAGSGLRYVCALAFVDGVDERVFFGECRGRWQPAPRGEGGFGYDPVFLPDAIAGPDDGRADRRGEGSDQPPRQRGARLRLVVSSSERLGLRS